MDNSIQAHQKELCNKLWAMANALRGNMEAYEFKNYILGMIFYYYLSDRTEKYMTNLLKDDNISYEDAWTDEEYKTAVVEEALRDLGFIIEPQFLFRKMVKMVENRSFDIEFLQKAINSLMESTLGNDSQEDFDGLCFVNLVDFDMLYGHRNDVKGYTDALNAFDRRLDEFLPKMRKDDVLMITADHGCDPGFPGTDHTREYVPIFCCGEKVKNGVNLGTRKSYADISATIAEFFGISYSGDGESFLGEIM